LIPPLLIITDRRNCVLPLEETVRQALEAGCRWIMLREKDLPIPEQVVLATELKKLCDEFEATLTVNGARQAADITNSIHVQDIDTLCACRSHFALIGYSAHSLDDVLETQDVGADYVTLSPIFQSISKPDYNKELGLEMLSEAASYNISIVALGGITPNNAAACYAAGSSGVAMMGAVMRSRDPGTVVKGLLNNLPSQ
jgi:thiamine-phosphate pyrophosphorylase